MIVTAAEKLILLMLSDLHDKLGLDGIDTKFLRSAINSDNTWAINWEMPELTSDLSDTPSTAVDVVDYLHMWGLLEDSWSSLSEESRVRISNLSPFGRNLKFPGFHGDAESEQYSIARLFVDDMGRFERFKGRDLNSHVPMCEQYKKMFIKFDAITESSNSPGLLSATEIEEVLVAGVTS